MCEREDILTQIIATLRKIRFAPLIVKVLFGTHENYLSKIAFLDEKRATCEDVED